MNVKPLDDRVLVQRVETEEKTDAGIIVPESAQEEQNEGIVRATGPGKVGNDGERIPVDVDEGDRVLFGEYSGTEVTIGGEEHLILRESELLAVFDD